MQFRLDLVLSFFFLLSLLFLYCTAVVILDVRLFLCFFPSSSLDNIFFPPSSFPFQPCCKIFSYELDQPSIPFFLPRPICVYSVIFLFFFLIVFTLLLKDFEMHLLMEVSFCFVLCCFSRSHCFFPRIFFFLFPAAQHRSYVMQPSCRFSCGLPLLCPFKPPTFSHLGVSRSP